MVGAPSARTSCAESAAEPKVADVMILPAAMNILCYQDNAQFIDLPAGGLANKGLCTLAQINSCITANQDRAPDPDASGPPIEPLDNVRAL